MKKFTMIALGCLLALFAVGCSTTTLVASLDDVAMLADAAAAFVPAPWNVYVIAAADAAQLAAIELQSSDPAKVQLTKILAAIDSVVAQTWTDAPAAVQTALKGIQAALQVVVHIIEGQLAAPVTPTLKATAAKPLKLGWGDQANIRSITKHVKHVHKVYGK